ncbi:MAG: aspartate-semialdehyde dehydrogenase [Chloroflexi bacterium 13_1_40CM_4_65_16]|nr:MAG: aspartate-semialdehyde dehydrogenase [Chloroflexi bacterium 13_1_40CM_66_19]OLC47739.1 MAG: aspartate-semialdehyde dehydrogenase [Chloroflexi bacterium 13_1_40CM_4_65_16]OLD05351.1 MAG: aspartate-semialdehyde dehydrogenase [Actinobacteria bacterium 13_1_40CM_3_66_19]OLE72616.1 MAG: aspartate-semialdehyde dehydrogenase [Actinobacteria bacterium 13_1_20CM_2_66_18]TMF35467.1 MAG: aspartate-semialdehyde dehydrogenase [Chloroflexota bacterium]
MVGNEMLRVLAQRQFPSERVIALASERSKGLTVPYNGSSLKVEELSEAAFKGIDVALFAASGDIALMYGPVAAESGALVIDNSSAWRMKENVPLVVPEVNGDDISDNEGIIANPNCCAIPLTVALNPLKKMAGLERVLVSTYQSASGAGRALVDELEEQTKAIADGKEPPVAAYPYQLAYNVVPGGWRLEADGYNEEEVKIVNETRKILHDPELRITATCVRVPVPIGHGESVFLETTEKITADDARTLLGNAPGIVVQDDPHARLYPTPHDVAGKDEVYIGRIREDASTRHGLLLWIVSDNLRKGAALNAVQIAEQAIQLGALGAVKT